MQIGKISWKVCSSLLSSQAVVLSNKSLELFGPKHLLSVCVCVCMQVNRNGERVEEKLQVFLRVRPLTDAERQRGEDQVTFFTSLKYYFIQYIKCFFLFFNIVCVCANAGLSVCAE